MRKHKQNKPIRNRALLLIVLLIAVLALKMCIAEKMASNRRNALLINLGPGVFARDRN